MIKEEVRKQYTATIGIECHVQLKTATKLFASVGNDAREAEPNTLVSHICFGLPGALPVLNKEAVHLSARAAFALGTVPQPFSKFDRKHYFYPDLPKGYQITQFDQPIIVGGEIIITVDGQPKRIGITRAHMEEDAGKSTHPEGADYSLVDLNRAGTPLLEIVSEPDMHTSAEAKAYAHELYLRMKYADVSDANLYYGNMRFDVNVSVSKTDELGTRSETKNLNSFRSVEKSVDYEIERQIKLLEAGEAVVQETRGWNDNKLETFSQRTKEDAHDYRYFPDPDLPPVTMTPEYIESIKAEMPVMPGDIRDRLLGVGVDRMSVEAILDNVALAKHWLNIQENSDSNETLKRIADWFSNIVTRQLIENPNINLAASINSDPTVLNIEQLIKLAEMQASNTLSSTSAKVIIAAYWTNLYDVEALAKEMNLIQESDEAAIAEIVRKVVEENPAAAEDVKNGEMKAIGFLVGQVMKASKGKANPGLASELIKKQLEV